MRQKTFQCLYFMFQYERNNISVRKGSANEEGSLERGKLRTKLFNFMKSRPTKESLEQKGIIKGNLFSIFS
jgi:hypothetical protein